VKYILLFCSITIGKMAFGQSTDLPLNSSAYSIYDEWDIKSEKAHFTTVKPISRREISELSLDESLAKSKAELYDKKYVQTEAREYIDSILPNRKPIFGRLYEYNSDMISVKTKDFDFHMNPVIMYARGRESLTSEKIFQNYRGVEMRGTIDGRVSFYSMLTENQARYPAYVRRYTANTLAVPYEGFWKQVNTTGVDFLRAQAYIDVNLTKHIEAQFGYGKHFIGNGMRSLILSDFGNNYPYLRLKTQIWKLQYTNIFAQLTAKIDGGDYGLLGTGEFPKKYLAMHHLSVNIAKKLNVGIFESIIYGQPDSLGNNGLRFEYLNPMIFYRSLEQQDGSSANAILGMDFKWNLFKTVSLYGQLAIDELIISKALSGDGYWENKQAYQLGVKYIDAFGLKNLSLQAEWNQVRPYTYSHQDYYTSYSHYNMPLAHPLGANFREVLFNARFRALPRLTFTGDVLLAQSGKDKDKMNYGGNILKSYDVRVGKEGEPGIDLLQGDKTILKIFHGNASYQVAHNLFTELDWMHRYEKSESGSLNSSNNVLTFALRYNFASRNYLF
jgi:hypothetical protein